MTNYTNINNIAHINGASGYYDNKVQDASTRYGKNSAINHFLSCGLPTTTIKARCLSKTKRVPSIAVQSSIYA